MIFLSFTGFFTLKETYYIADTQLLSPDRNEGHF